jgi:terminal uridylyltransferase
MRATRILSTRPERAHYAIVQLCEERVDVLTPATSPTAAFVPPRLSPFPPQTPYTVGSSPMRLTMIEVPDPNIISDTPQKPLQSGAVSAPGPSTSTPNHMGPKRSKWTSPPPPSASAEDRSQFESQLGLGLALATLPTDARQTNGGYASSSNNSEILTDDGDDLQSIQSLSLSEAPERDSDKCNGVSASLPSSSPLTSSPLVSTLNMAANSPSSPIPGGNIVSPKAPYIVPRESYPPVLPNPLQVLRGRSARHLDFISTSPRLNSPRRSHSGPPGPLSAGFTGKPFPLLTMAVMTPLPPSPPPPPLSSLQPYVYYESAPSPTMVYPVSPRYPPRFHAAAAAAAAAASSVAARVRLAPSPTATPTAYSQFRVHHAHSHSLTTVHARTPSPVPDAFATRIGCGDSVQSTGSVSPSPPDSLSAGSGSPSPSSLSSQCDAGVDLVRWEEGGDGEDCAATATASAASDAEKAKTKEDWGAIHEKVPSDVLSQPTREPLPP